MPLLTILFQDEFLVAIDKPPGMMVPPVANLTDAETSAMKLLRDQLGTRVYPVHRLDRPTSGVLLFALDKKSAAIMQQAFEHREVAKSYLAVVCGNAPDRWSCETPLAANLGHPPLAARTSFERIAITKTNELGLVLSLLKAIPTTGRFHQIRRHLLETGYPIAGDFRYAGMETSFKLGEILETGTRMLLQANMLEFKHPHSGEPLRIENASDSDFTRLFSMVHMD